SAPTRPAETPIESGRGDPTGLQDEAGPAHTEMALPPPSGQDAVGEGGLPSTAAAAAAKRASATADRARDDAFAGWTTDFFASDTFTVRSSPPVASSRPSGLKATPHGVSV